MDCELKEISQQVCKTCMYSGNIGSFANFKTHTCCEYLLITGESRYFVDGKKSYDPKYCNKYVKKTSERKKHWMNDDNFFNIITKSKEVSIHECY